jgi:hypothetical protein
VCEIGNILDYAGGAPDRYDAILTHQSLVFELSAHIVIGPVLTCVSSIFSHETHPPDIRHG